MAREGVSEYPIDALWHARRPVVLNSVHSSAKGRKVRSFCLRENLVTESA